MANRLLLIPSPPAKPTKIGAFFPEKSAAPTIEGSTVLLRDDPGVAINLLKEVRFGSGPMEKGEPLQMRSPSYRTERRVNEIIKKRRALLHLLASF
ncbi:MAG: hypothetical protein EPO39_13750 [Candidatus Manganitrophaceae bacterium]|nr:MAG: hypothetical protein EPO39_13750 [Candidatus Manganitrophaceae bacterium]